jgi:aerotaxis receptor
MRVNLPVIAQEYAFPKGQTLVSTTDLKGRILYCNPMFIEVSGYAKEELLGQPHNIVRHPDMPEEAYRDMWETISNGMPWSAAVKNRRKDGTFYWVMANVTPLMQGEQPTGYMSVRTEATRAQIQNAEHLYARMREEKQAGTLVHALQAGRLVKRTWWGRIQSMVRLGAFAKIMACMLVLVLAAWLAASSGQQNLTALSGAMWVGVVLLALGVGQYIHHVTVTPMTQMLGWANRMAAGDLTQAISVTRDDTVGQLQKALSQLNVNLLSIVRDARQESENMQVSTREIAQGNQDLSSRTESQASNLEQTAASIEEITGTVKQTAESARQATLLASEATQVAEHSSEAVDGVALTMQSIQAASGRIGEITQLIDSIAFQTNILALNAAVEAARAGDQGRGFAVVAAEVRSLSHRTLSAAKEIRELIDDSATKVHEGHLKTDSAQKTMAKSLELVRRVNTLIGEIHNAADEQLSGISQVNAAVAQLDTITQQNAALVEENTASAMELQGQAQSMNECVHVFRVDAGDTAPPPQAVELRKAMRVRKMGRSVGALTAV